MPDLEQLRRLSGEVRPPAFESLEQVAGRRDRRATLALGLASVAAVVAVLAGGLVMVDFGGDHAEPAPVAPIPTKPARSEKPTHASETSMSPKEVVLAYDATLELIGVSADDPDFRVSKWRATCHWCPKSEVGRPSFTALAITTDGYATATYRRAPFDSGLEHVVSPGPGLLLIVDGANGYEWLVRRDGSITALQHDFDDVPAADPRLWFVCLASTGHTSSGGAATPYDARLTWCVLDPEADTVHVWEGPWEGTDFAVGVRPSLVSPGSADPMWGFQDQIDDRLVAWWLADGTRHYRDLGPSTENGAVLNSPPGTMSYWSWLEGSDTLKVFTSADKGSTWRTAELGVSFRPDGYYFGLAYTPGGALIGRQDDALRRETPSRAGEGLRLWRAELVKGGSFEMVYESRSGTDGPNGYPTFTMLDDTIWTARFWSDDDGETWIEESTWR
jgi:hypothetical protein